VVNEKILQNVQAIFPKNLSSQLTNPLERITQRITDFIRGNPLVSTAAVGIGTTGLVAAATTFIRKRRKKRAAKRKVSKRKKAVRKRAKVKRRKRITHRRPRHKGHKRVSFTTARGQKVSFLVRGAKRSPQHRRKKSRTARRFIKGSPEAKRFMAKLRRMKR